MTAIGTLVGRRTLAVFLGAALSCGSGALAQAPARKWTVVDMKKDWRTIFPTPW
jgi:hypothetical protein